MNTKNNSTRLAILAGLLAIGIGGARFSRLGGQAAGDDGRGVGCGAPTEIGATTGAAFAEPATGVSSQAITATSCTPTVPTRSATSGAKTYYDFAESKTTWSSAKAFCATLGGQLANPTTAAENAAVKSALSTQRTYLGPYQPNSQKTPSKGWLTIGGTSISYTNWLSGQPSDDNGVEINQQNCSAMDPTTGEWDDVSCSNTQGYDWVCEFASTAPVTCGSTATCTIPSGSTTYSCGCATSGYTYDATTNACLAPFAVSSLSPSSAWYTSNSTIKIAGTGFDSGTTLTVNGASVTPTINSATSASFTLPTAWGAATVPVVLTNSAGSSVSTTFQYTMGTGTWSGGPIACDGATHTVSYTTVSGVTGGSLALQFSAMASATYKEIAFTAGQVVQSNVTTLSPAVFSCATQTGSCAGELIGASSAGTFSANITVKDNTDGTMEIYLSSFTYQNEIYAPSHTTLASCSLL